LQEVRGMEKKRKKKWGEEWRRDGNSGDKK